MEFNYKVWFVRLARFLSPATVAIVFVVIAILQSSFCDCNLTIASC